MKIWRRTFMLVALFAAVGTLSLFVWQKQQTLGLARQDPSPSPLTEVITDTKSDKQEKVATKVNTAVEADSAPSDNQEFEMLSNKAQSEVAKCLGQSAEAHSMNDVMALLKNNFGQPSRPVYIYRIVHIQLPDG